MANPDLINGYEPNNSKSNNIIYSVLIGLFIIVPVIWSIVMFVSGDLQRNNTGQPNCYYSGDEYICDR